MKEAAPAERDFFETREVPVEETAVAAAPPSIGVRQAIERRKDPLLFLNRFLGTWELLRDKSDPMEEVSKALGVNWVIRRAIEQFTPSCRYVRLPPFGLKIVTLLPLNNTRSVTLQLDGSPVTESDSDVGGAWASTTRVDNEVLITQRKRGSDGLIVTETRQLQLVRPHRLDTDILWYLAEVRMREGGEVIAASNRYYRRIEGPPRGVALPLKKQQEQETSRPIRMIASLDELPELTNPSDPPPTYASCCNDRP